MKAFHANLSLFRGTELFSMATPLTKVYLFFSCRNYFIDDDSATIRVEIRAPVVECQGRHLQKEKRKSPVKHKPAGGNAMPAGWAN